jgi:RNA polymerase sigma-70 factor (ECF subfamily)
MSEIFPYDEAAILAQIAEGNEKAFEQLFEKYSDNIYGVAFNYTKSAEVAEEVTQDVFVKLWFKRKSLATLQSLENYLFIIARNHIINIFNRNKKDKNFIEHILHHFEENNATPEDILLFKESQELIAQAIATLPHQQQMVYELRRIQGLSLEEVAGKMEISRNTARNHLNRALQNIRQFLKDHSTRLVLFICLLDILEDIL